MDALGKETYEGRSWVRKAPVRYQQPIGTGDFRMGQPILYTRMPKMAKTVGSEISQYHEEKKP